MDDYEDFLTQKVNVSTSSVKPADDLGNWRKLECGKDSHLICDPRVIVFCRESSLFLSLGTACSLFCSLLICMAKKFI